MSGFTGMDTDQVRALGEVLTAAGARIEELKGEISSQLGSVQWNGIDRQQFDSSWEGEHSASLQMISDNLEKFGAEAEKQAAEQDDTSAS